MPAEDQPMSTPAVMKRAAVTYGRRRDDVPALTAPDAPSLPTNGEDFHDDLKPFEDASGTTIAPDEELEEELDTPTVGFGWRAKLKELDSQFDNVDHVPISRKAQEPESGEHDSKRVYNAESTQARSPSPLGGSRPAVLEEPHSDSEDEQSSPTAATPHRQASPFTPPTSETEMPSAISRKLKGKQRAIVHDNVPDASLGDVSMDSQTNRAGKTRGGKAPTKKDKRESVLENARIQASRRVEVTRAVDAQHTLEWLLDRVKEGPTTLTAPTVPSSDPIQQFSSSPTEILSLDVESRSTSFGAASSLLGHPAHIISDGPASETANLSNQSDDEDMPDLATIMKREEQQRASTQSKQDLQRVKAALLRAQATNAFPQEDSDDDLEVVKEDVHVTAEEEASKRKIDKALGTYKGGKNIIPLLRGAAIPHSAGASKSSPLKGPRSFEATLRESSRPAFIAAAKHERDQKGVRSLKDLNLMLRQQTESENAKQIKDKEEEWVKRGGKIRRDEELGQSIQEKLAAARQKLQDVSEPGQDDDEMDDEDYADSQGSDEDDEDYSPAIRGSASPEPERSPSSIDASEQLLAMTETDDERDISDDEENLPRKRQTRPTRILDSDDDEENSRPSGSKPTSMVSHGEDDNDKENDNVAFEANDDKENQSALRHSPLSSRPVLGSRPGSLFGLEDGMRGGLAFSDIRNESSKPEEVRTPLKELREDDDEADPFSLSTPQADQSFTSRLLSARSVSPEAKISTPRRGSSPDGKSGGFKSPLGTFEPPFQEYSSKDGGGLLASFEPSFREATTNQGLSQFFAATGAASSRKDTQGLSLTLDVGLQPALDVKESVRRQADDIFDKEQADVVEAANRKPASKEVLYVNDHGFLTQTRPESSTPILYRHPTQLTQHPTQRTSLMDQFTQPFSERTPLRTLSYSKDVETSGQPLTRLRRRSSSPTPDARATAIDSPSVQRNAFDVLGKDPKRAQKKLAKSEYVTAEAVESDEEEAFGFGAGKGESDEEEEDDQDKVVEGLLDDAGMDENAKREDLVQEKFREHVDEDDRALEKLHRDAAEGKLRMKRRDRGVGFEDESDDGEDEELSRNIRRGMYKKRKIDGDDLEALGQNQETRAFYDTYQQDLMEDENEFAHLHQDDAAMMDAEDEDDQGMEAEVSVDEVRRQLRQVAAESREQEDLETLNPYDTSWVDRGQDEDEDINIKILSSKGDRQAGTQPDNHIQHRQGDRGSEQERAQLKTWSRGQGSRRQGTGRSGAGSAITGHKAKVGNGTLKNLPTNKDTGNTGAIDSLDDASV
ncbi:hypothetical protein CONPUDRAFT_153372 [Coniophora puteana RWD-64-598 SS2]|uniref:DNA replication checkpoint mediator MRC1 domain-containing protein n=1 Tax=Coniophora puteana (strain RWD-64-598) TaxID=741705 RepID=A0A5M3MTK4_CONPW|nr:uncharacterized protein CONPUDRAFT_153372 [Coniophora puteana RWD-64-598 SS2]EIW82499.1 hypothetical protein CONPUDRAFT_153372 [Coniophora puteana RWD-64-598 SS2]